MLLFTCLLYLGIGDCDGSQGAPVAVTYVPGDSYFHSRLTDEVVQRCRRDRVLRLIYDTPFAVPDSFQSSVGFYLIDVKDVTDAFVKGISDVYSEYRPDPLTFKIRTDKKGNELREEICGLHLFVYHKDFDLNKNSVGFRYNNRWSRPPADSGYEEAGPFGPLTFRMPYQSLIKGEYGILEDWRGSHTVPSLPANVPNNVRWAAPSSGGTEAVHVKLADVRVLVLEGRKLSTYTFHDGPRQKILDIDSNGFTEIKWNYDDEKWEAQKIEKK